MHTCQDLAAPLVGSSLFLGRCQELLVGCLDIGLIRNDVIEEIAARTVGAGCQHDNDSAFLCSCLACSHSLGRLISILIQRISAVCCDDDIGICGLHADIIRNEITAFAVCRLKVARECRDGLLVLIDDNIDNVGQLSHPCRRQHILMHGVVIQNAGAGIGAVDKFGAVVAHDRDSVRHAGKDTLAAAGETGEEMRFNKALRNKKLCVDRHFVDDAVGSAGK